MLRWGLVAIVIAAAGCSSHTYVIEMVGRGPTLERSVAEVGKDEAPRFEKLYGQSVRDGKVRGEFTIRTPDDIGGAGWHEYFGSTLGSVTGYSERFGGSDDLAGNIDRIYRGVDKLTDALIAWFGSELARDEAWPRLRAFMDETMRHDLRNVALMGAMLKAAPDKGPEGEGVLARVLHYLAEHGYVDPEDLRGLRITGEDNGAERVAMAYVQRMVARRMGLPDAQPIPRGLAFLENTESAKASFITWYQTTDDYTAQLARWEKQRRDQPGLEKPLGPDEQQWPQVKDLAEAAFPEIFGHSENVVATLACPVTPMSTNGEYDEAKKVVRWQRRIDRKFWLPAVCYAVWAEPNEAEQRRLLGKGKIGDQSLLGYVLWRNQLTDAEGREWDAMLAGAEARTLDEKLDAFHFATEKADDPASRSKPGIDILRQALHAPLAEAKTP